MKKFKLLFLVMLIFCGINVMAQTQTKTVDIGYDWDITTPTTVKATTGTIFDAETPTYIYTFNSGAVSEVNFIVGGGATIGAAAKNSVYTATSSQVPEAFSYVNLSNSVDVQYFEGNIAQDCEFVSIKLNGVSSSTTAATDVAMVYSDKVPFDVSSVIGYTEAPFAMQRAGTAAVNVTGIPTDTKSFRLYSRARILPIIEEVETGKYYLYASGTPEGVTVGAPIQVGYSNSNQTRLAYVSVTYKYEDNTTSIENSVIDNNKVAISKSFYDLSGRTVSESVAKGILIQKTVYEDGTSSFDKIYIK